MKQEDKAKAYDKVRKKIAIRFGSNVADEFFAEFEGSKDEEIRKALLEMVHDTTGDELWIDYNVHKEEALDWLEKQGQVKESAISQHENRTCEENSNSLTSEDERIRKDLIGFFKDEAFLCHKKKQIIAWLKKQGDSPIKWNKNTKDCKPQKNHSVLMKTTHGIAEGEWQGEKWFQYRWSSSIKDSDVLFWIELSDIEDQGGQKFEMKSAEESLGIDSDKYNKIIDECIFGEQKAEENKGNLGGISSNSEWSEEDEAVLKQIDASLRVAESYYFSDGFREEVKSLRNWLKSIKGRVQPQNTWKPSDEQIECLSDAIEHYNSLGYPAPKLKELLDDLKKLKEEQV